MAIMLDHGSSALGRDFKIPKCYLKQEMLMMIYSGQFVFFISCVVGEGSTGLMGRDLINRKC